MTQSRWSPHPALDRAIDLSRGALAAAPAGLLTDFDGTLAPLVADPGLARLVDGTAGALAVLARRLAVVAVITGRGALEARQLSGIRDALVVGNHGVEWLDPGSPAPAAAPGGERIAAALRRATDTVDDDAGVHVEHKGLSATVHYRRAADPDVARSRILAALGDVAAHGLELREGRMSVELRPVGMGDKGSAARAIVERHGLRGAVVMGDDLTDLDMFRVVDRLRAEGALRGAIIGVGGQDRETPPAVREQADVVLDSPAEVALLLAALSAEPAPADPPAGDAATT